MTKYENKLSIKKNKQKKTIYQRQSFVNNEIYGNISSNGVEVKLE